MHVIENNQGFRTFQEFLDTYQYSNNGILIYERICGRHFVSTGGLETTQVILYNGFYFNACNIFINALLPFNNDNFKTANIYVT